MYCSCRSDEMITESIIDLWLRVSWGQVHIWTSWIVCSNTMVIMDKQTMAQVVPPIRISPDCVVTNLLDNSSCLKGTMESPEGAPSVIPCIYLNLTAWRLPLSNGNSRVVKSPGCVLRQAQLSLAVLPNPSHWLRCLPAQRGDIPCS